MGTAEALTGKGVQIVTADGQSRKSTSNQDKGDVCLTSGCVHAASKMLEQLNEDVEPCDDFYNFACGNFVENTIIPDDKVSVNTFSVISDKLQEQLRTIVTAPVDENEIAPFKNVKKLYLACMNKSKLLLSFFVL
jgi:neprilysin